MWLHSKPHRLVVQHMLEGLLSCRSVQASRKSLLLLGPQLFAHQGGRISEVRMSQLGAGLVLG
jgi:hypothetical protein